MIFCIIANRVRSDQFLLFHIRYKVYKDYQRKLTNFVGLYSWSLTLLQGEQKRTSCNKSNQDIDPVIYWSHGCKPQLTLSRVPKTPSWQNVYSSLHGFIIWNHIWNQSFRGLHFCGTDSFDRITSVVFADGKFSNFTSPAPAAPIQSSRGCGCAGRDTVLQ